jgi:hypothetical protein
LACHAFTLVPLAHPLICRKFHLYYLFR